MDSIKVLYGVRIGNEDWQEEILTETADRIEAAKAWALQNGFDRLRVATIDLSKPPDFRNVFNKRKAAR